MKHLLLLFFIAAILCCQYFWIKLRKTLPNKQKEWDSHLTGKLDLTSLSVLLGGYLFIFFFPYPVSLFIYFFVAVVIGILSLIVYYRVLKQRHYPKKYIRLSLGFAAVMFFLTVIIGLIVILAYNIK